MLLYCINGVKNDVNAAPGNFRNGRMAPRHSLAVAYGHSRPVRDVEAYGDLVSKLERESILLVQGKCAFYV